MHMQFNGQHIMGDEELLRKVIFPNVPPLLKNELELQGGTTMDWRIAKVKLTKLFQNHNMEINRKSNSRNNNNFRSRNRNHRDRHYHSNRKNQNYNNKNDNNNMHEINDF